MMNKPNSNKQFKFSFFGILSDETFLQNGLKKDLLTHPISVHLDALPD